jgi:hypothetical protein
VKVATEILVRYAGTYELRAKELFGVDLVPIKVALEEGELRLGIGDGPKDSMAAISQSTFTGFGGYIDFVANEKGETTQLVIHIAEGDFPAKRRQN